MVFDSLDSWLHTLPQEDGYPCISDPRRFAHDENAYDQQYSVDPSALRSGKGFLNLLAARGVDASGPLMEIGCGTGYSSLGLATGGVFPQTLLTDPSPVFLSITRKKLVANGIPLDNVRFAVFTGEDLYRVPVGFFSAITLRSTLHHVFDIGAFIGSTSKALRPGGMLIAQEPFAEGFLLMAAIAQFLPAAASADGHPLTPSQIITVQLLLDTMAFYIRRDVDKSNAEDKHVFRAEELQSLCQRRGMAAEFIGNLNSEQFADSPPNLQAVLFSQWFHDYVRYCLSWDESMMQLFRKYLAPACQFIDRATAGTCGPHFSGIMIARKTS